MYKSTTAHQNFLWLFLVIPWKFVVFTSVFHPHTYKVITTTAQFTFYNCKWHFTTAEIVISYTLKYALLLACVRSISFVSFLLFVTGIFPLQLLPAFLRFLYVLASCFSVFFSTIALQKFQVILYPLISWSSTLNHIAQHSISLFYHPFLQNYV